MSLYENFLVPVCKNVGGRPYSSFGQESCKPYRTVGLYGGPRLPNLEQFFYARLAQLGEHLPYKQRVGGSSPSLRTRQSVSFLVGITCYGLVEVKPEFNDADKPLSPF